MCLTIPAKIISINKNKAVVEIDKKRQTANMRLCRVKRGDYVIIKNGYIIQKIKKDEAKKTLQLFKKGGI